MAEVTHDTSNASSEPPARAGSALLLKTRAGAEDRQQRGMSLAKALRLTVARVADRQLDLAMAAIGVHTVTREGHELAQELEEDALLLLLDGPGGRRAGAVLDRALVGGLLQQETMGKVTAPAAPETRALTATDAAVCAPFLDALLGQAAELPDDPAQQALLAGYRFGAQVEAPRLLLMALDAPRYEVVHLTLDIAVGTRQGKMVLCLPEADQPAEEATPAGQDDQPAVSPTGARLDKVVLGLTADLRVALASLRLPLGHVQNLRAGDVLELGVTSFDQASVVTRAGRRLGGGTLGQINGMRALQLEHQTQSQGLRHPRRRASDRALLELPQVSGDGTGTRPTSAAEAPLALTHAALERADPDPGSKLQADMSELPDMSDLPGFEEAG